MERVGLKTSFEELMEELNTLYGVSVKQQRIDKTTKRIIGTNEGHYHTTFANGYQLVQYTNSKARIRVIATLDTKKELVAFIRGMIKGYRDAEEFYKV